MGQILLVAIGGAIGALSRYFMSGLVINGTSFPWGTLAVNLLGCFLIGIMWGASSAFEFGNSARMFVFVGILGAFTTFSTFALENFSLFRDGQVYMFITNVLASNIIGIALVFAGYYIASLMFAK